MKTQKHTPNQNQTRTTCHDTPGGTEGALRATGVPPGGGQSKIVVVAPDPEVKGIRPRRRFTAKYKLSVLKEADACFQPGDIGELLRREGLYSSHLTTWRRQRMEGILSGVSPKKRGRKIKEKNPLAQKVAELEKENQRLKMKLKKAEIIIDVQKKISEMLGIPMDDNGEDKS